MITYGKTKRNYKLHSHNKCEVCGEEIVKNRGSIKHKVNREIDQEIRENK